jgi:two-component system chemotaxis response regulator CheY
MYKIAKILIVDDDAAIRRVLDRLLTRAGYDVIQAANGFEAIDSYRAHPVDLVITDMYMPGADGLDVINRLRAEYPQARFIAISGGGFVDPARALEAASVAGALNTLPKPFSPDALLRTLTDCFATMPENARVT